MISGMSIEQGDIWLVPFPFSDMTRLKKRPVLVLSGRAFNKNHQDVLVCQITTNLLRVNDFCVRIGQDNVEEGDIKKENLIKTHRLFTIDKRLFIKKVGKLKQSALKQVIEKVVGIFKD